MEEKFNKGDILELLDDRGLGAKVGATAVCTGYEDSYINIEWVRSNKKCHRQENGGYNQEDFKLHKCNWRKVIENGT